VVNNFKKIAQSAVYGSHITLLGQTGINWRPTAGVRNPLHLFLGIEDCRLRGFDPNVADVWNMADTERPDTG
jgi:hypothetical protein